MDGAVVSRAEAQLTSLFDLERVEVLRGPQGSLYGRNAVGGSINLITAKPTEELDGYARLSFGDYDYINFEGAIGGPIAGDWLLGRIAVKTEDRDGFGENPVTGNDVDVRLHASLSAAVISAMKGAKIVRVHDVKATVDALKVVTAVEGL